MVKEYSIIHYDLQELKQMVRKWTEDNEIQVVSQSITIHKCNGATQYIANIIYNN